MIAQLSQIFHYREAIRNFVVRDLKVRYSHSALGFLWSLFNPLLLMLVFWVVFTFMAGQGIDRLPIYILAGLLPWNYFSSSILLSTVSITGNSYSLDQITNPVLKQLVLIVNPMASLVANYRSILYRGAPPDLTLLAVTAGEALAAFLIGLIAFTRLSPAFAEEI